MFKYWDKRTIKPKDLVYIAMTILFLEWIISSITERPFSSNILDITFLLILLGILEASILFSKRKDKTLNEK